MEKLLKGLRHFVRTIYRREQEFFKKLADGQQPTVLFITCSDSRVDPSLITQSSPGELFVMRNAGNIVPAYDADHGGEAATLEYAVTALGVEHIVVCGHSNCGAMIALLEPDKADGMPLVSRWLEHARPTQRILKRHGDAIPPQSRVRVATKLNTLAQLEHLQSHPSVANRLQGPPQNRVQLHAWYYDIGDGVIEAFDSDEGAFIPLSPDAEPATGHRQRDLQRLIDLEVP